MTWRMMRNRKGTCCGVYHSHIDFEQVRRIGDESERGKAMKERGQATASSGRRYAPPLVLNVRQRIG
jgi:hypothetical protein